MPFAVLAMSASTHWNVAPAADGTVKVFCDTSVLVAAFVASHEHHARARSLVQQVVDGKVEGVVAAHTLAELYAVLTRLPVVPRITPTEASRMVTDNVVAHFSVQTLSGSDYAALVRKAPGSGIAGGTIYDALLLACAAKADVERICTLNVADFERLAPELSSRMAAP